MILWTMDLFRDVSVSLVHDNALSHVSPKRSLPKRCETLSDTPPSPPIRKPDLQPLTCRWQSMPSRRTDCRWSSSSPPRRPGARKVQDLSPRMVQRQQQAASCFQQQESTSTDHLQRQATTTAKRNKKEALKLIGTLLDNIGDCDSDGPDIDVDEDFEAVLFRFRKRFPNHSIQPAVVLWCHKLLLPLQQYNLMIIRILSGPFQSTMLSSCDASARWTSSFSSESIEYYSGELSDNGFQAYPIPWRESGLCSPFILQPYHLHVVVVDRSYQLNDSFSIWHLSTYALAIYDILCWVMMRSAIFRLGR